MKRIVEINMDKIRHLKYGMNTMIELEKGLGKSLSSIKPEEFTFENLRTILFFGLKWEDKSLTPDTVGDLMDTTIDNNENGIQYISEKVGEAVQGAFGTKNAIPS